MSIHCLSFDKNKKNKKLYLRNHCCMRLVFGLLTLSIYEQNFECLCCSKSYYLTCRCRFFMGNWIIILCIRLILPFIDDSTICTCFFFTHCQLNIIFLLPYLAPYIIMIMQSIELRHSLYIYIYIYVY